MLITSATIELKAQDYSDPVADGEIVVERMKDNTQLYKQRRSRFGAIFSVNQESFLPKNYFSLVQNKSYKEILDDKAISITGAELGLKFNFQLGSLTALAGYGQGQIYNDSTGVDKITVNISKADINLALDNFMNEPYIVPYVQIGLHSIGWNESGTIANLQKEESFTTEYSMHYKAGLSLQLNWIEKSIDPSSQEDALRSSGLENTFLDVFYTSYPQPAQVAAVAGVEGEADLNSDQFGLGLKLEF